jgi:hypothetical protein
MDGQYMYAGVTNAAADQLTFPGYSSDNWKSAIVICYISVMIWGTKASITTLQCEFHFFL